MRSAGVVLLFFASTLPAQQPPSQQFRAAYNQWTAHRPDGMTWHDDSSVATHALETMWTAAAQVAADFLATHREATPKDLSAHLASLLPTTDPRSGPPLSAQSLELKPGLFLVAFNSSPAANVFLIASTSAGPKVVWNLSLASAQQKGPRHLLASWHVSRAGDACVMKFSYAAGVCGPMESISLGSLPQDGAGQPRFFISATYAKDMGATLDEQISVWRLDENAPTLDWIHLYAEGGEDPVVSRGIEYKAGALLIPEKHEFATFTSCGSCFGRQMIHRLKLTPAGVEDGGLVSVHPELDAIDQLFGAIFKGQSAAEIASPQVIRFLQPRLATAKAESTRTDPDWLNVGMLEGFTVSQSSGMYLLCFESDLLEPLDFKVTHKRTGYFISDVSPRAGGSQCGGLL